MCNGSVCKDTARNGKVCNRHVRNGKVRNGRECNGKVCNGNICNGKVCKGTLCIGRARGEGVTSKGGRDSGIIPRVTARRNGTECYGTVCNLSLIHI